MNDDIDELMTEELAYGCLRDAFEVSDASLTEEQYRRLQLVMISYYAKFYGLFDVAKRASVAKGTVEEVNDMLTSIGFSFDGKRLHKIDDKITSIPSLKTVKKPSIKSSKTVLSEDKD
jgi:hypothetical protein